MMWQWLSRVLIAGWFVGMVVLAVVNRPVAEAEGRGSTDLYLPLVHVDATDGILHEYMGLVRGGSSYDDFYTVRGNGTEWGVLVEGIQSNNYAWSPDGFNFVYTKPILENGQAIPFTWLIPLNTRVAQPLLRGEYGLRWSPDSQRLALINSTHLYVFEVATQQITEMPLPITGGMPTAETIVWTEDSQQVAWRVGRKVWVWLGISSAPTLVYEGGRVVDQLYWSPDGNRLLINSAEYGMNTGIYQSNPAGAPATLLLDQYLMRGWVDGAQRLLLWRDSWLYLASPDGGSIYLYSDYRIGTDTNIFPSPVGNWIGMNTNYFGFYLKPVPNGGFTPIEACSYMRWQPEGSRFACERSWFPLTTIGDVRSGSPVIDETLDNYGNPQFLPNSENLISLNKYYISNSGGYPHAKYEAPYLHFIGTSFFKMIRSPLPEPISVIEWRHMP